MTDEQPIDLIRCMPQLYYAAEVAAHAHADHVPYEYAATVELRAGAMYQALADRIIASDLTALQRATAATALQMLRDAPRQRARIDLAGKAFNSIPAGDAVLGADARRLLQENFEASTVHRGAEASAMSDLMRLLHAKAA